MTNTTDAFENAVIISYPPSQSQLRAQRCSVLKTLYIEPGTLPDYHCLSHYHYRQTALGPIAGIWTVRSRITSPYIENEPIAVIVYTYPAPNLAVRNIATRKFFCRRDKSQGLTRLNQHVRCISRIIVEPRWRGLGLASWLVRATMPVMDVAMIESIASMGRFHPFLDNAGMRPYCPPEDPASKHLAATLVSLNIGRQLWHDPDAVQVRMDCLLEKQARLLERAIKSFLGRFGKRRKMMWSIERTTFILEHLSRQWTYFAWLNPKIPVEGLKLQKINYQTFTQNNGRVILSAAKNPAGFQKQDRPFACTQGDMPYLMQDINRKSNIENISPRDHQSPKEVSHVA